MTYNPREYWESRLKRDFTLEGVGFDSFSKSFNRWLYKGAKHSLESVIQKGLISPRGNSVLDIGCGTGFYIDVWRNCNIDSLIGIDIAPMSIYALRRKYREFAFWEADITSKTLLADCPLGTFDIVTTCSVLLHIVDDDKFEQAIKNIKSLLADDGMILITDIFPHKRAYILPHQKSRTLSDYEKVLGDNGLEIVNRIPVHYLLNAPLDISNGFIQKLVLLFWWKMFVGGVEKATHLLAPILYGIDSILTQVCSESPTTEMMICRKCEQ